MVERLVFKGALKVSLKVTIIGIVTLLTMMALSPITIISTAEQPDEWQLMITDPAESQAYPDIKEVYVKNDGIELSFKVVFYDEFPSYELGTLIFLDIDQNVNTGSSGENNDIGSDYALDVGLGNSTMLKIYDEEHDYFIPWANFTYLNLQTNNSFLEVRILLSDINNTEVFDFFLLNINVPHGPDYSPDLGEGHLTYYLNSSPTIVYVYDNFDMYTPGWGYDHFDTIQNATNNVSVNGTVFVYNGIYNSSIRIYKPLELKGEDKNSTILNVTDYSNTQFTDCIAIRSDYVHIDNLSITNGNTAGIAFRYPELGDHCTITNCSLYENNRGLYSGHTILNTTVANCYFDKNLQSAIDLTGGFINITDCQVLNATGNQFPHGIVIRGNSNDVEIKSCTLSNLENGIYLASFGQTNGIWRTVNNVTISECVMNNCNNSIYLNCSYNSTITNNNITQNDFFGIYLNNSANNQIINNDITESNIGIYLLDSANNNTITNNNISNNTCDGIILISSANNAITNNNITNSDSCNGITLTNSADNTITNNNISNNRDYGIYLTSTANSNIIYHNDIIYNIAKNAIDYGSNKWDNGYPSGGNYWSDYDETSEGAYDNNSDGIIDTPYDVNGSINQDLYPLAGPWGNRPYVPILIQPLNASTDISTSPTLKVRVSDPNNDTMNVTFYSSPGNAVVGSNINVANGDTASVIWSSLSYSTSYYWYVIVNDSTYLTRSGNWSFTTESPGNNGGGDNQLPQDTEPPSKVTGLSVTDAHNGKLNLSWNAAIDNENVSHYNIYRDDSFLTTSSTTKYQDTGLNNGQTYRYEVSAVDTSNNEGEKSDPATGIPTALIDIQYGSINGTIRLRYQTQSIPARDTSICIYTGSAIDSIQETCTKTNQNGYYIIPSVEVGSYNIKAFRSNIFESTIQTIEISANQITTNNIIIDINETRWEIENGINEDKIGGEITIKKINENNYDSDINIYDNTTIQFIKLINISENRIDIQISGKDNTSGKTFIFSIDKNMFDIEREFIIEYDGLPINKSIDIQDILNPDDDNGEAEYFIIIEENITFMISVPSFSIHELSIYNIKDLKEIVDIITGPVAIAIYLIVCLIGIGMYTFPVFSGTIRFKRKRYKK